MKLVEANEPWLGKVPRDWERSRIRNEAILSPGFSSGLPTPTETCAVVPMESLSTDGAIDFSNQQSFEDIPSGLTLFERADVLFAKITPCMENGKGAFVSELPTRYAFGSTEFHVLRPCHRVDGRFLYYATFNPTFRAYAAENMTGAAGQKRVSSRFLKETRLFLPPLPEQQRIAAYLDASCAAIDASVAAKRRQLETLDAMRESLIESAVTKGVRPNAPIRPVNEDWITEVPAHWEVCRIKRIVSRVDYGISESTEPEGRYPVLKMGHIQCGEIEFRDLDFVDETSEDLLLETGDLLYNRTNSPDQVGKAAIFRRSKTDEITFASYLVRLRTNHRANPYFLNYLVNSSGFLSFARKLAIPSVQQSNLNSTRYCRMLIPRPPIEEQCEIVAYLDAKTAEVSRIVAGIETQIATLTAYRKSLIHECVTGQRRITESDVQRAAAQRKFDNLALTG
jgi:type I restriction enzyme S subunit